MSRIYPSALALCIALLFGPSISHSAAAAETKSPKALVKAMFYEGDGASQDVVCTVPLTVPAVGGAEITTEIDFRHSNDWDCDNDETRSVKLYGLTPGSQVFVADKDDCSGDNALITINSTPDTTPIVVHDYENDSTDPRYSIDRNSKKGGSATKGLNGKVSCGWITVAAPH